MIIELLDKTTHHIEEIPLREYVDGIPRGVTGKLANLLELCEGGVLQNTKTAVRIKDIPHTFEW